MTTQLQTGHAHRHQHPCNFSNLIFSYVDVQFIQFHYQKCELLVQK